MREGLPAEIEGDRCESDRAYLSLFFLSQTHRKRVKRPPGARGNRERLAKVYKLSAIRSTRSKDLM